MIACSKGAELIHPSIRILKLFGNSRVRLKNFVKLSRQWLAQFGGCTFRFVLISPYRAYSGQIGQRFWLKLDKVSG